MAFGSSSSYRRRARSLTTGDMVERQRRHRFEQVTRLGRSLPSSARSACSRFAADGLLPAAVDFPRAASGAARSVYSPAAVDGHFPGV